MAPGTSGGAGAAGAAAGAADGTNFSMSEAIIEPSGPLPTTS